MSNAVAASLCEACEHHGFPHVASSRGRRLQSKAMKNFWLVKQEPSDYSWSDFVADGGTSWTGVRNFAARNNLRRMSKGDEVLFYHSGAEKAVVGIAKVAPVPYRDTTAQTSDWTA